MQMGQEQEQQEGEETVLPVDSYPDLTDAAEGQKVTLLGTVKSNDGKDVTISYDSVKLEENKADKAIQKMTGKKAAPAAAAPAADEGEDY